MKHTKQCTSCDIRVRHAACTVSGCGFVTSSSEEDDVEMTRNGEGSGESCRDEDDFEKQMRLTNLQ